jgi:hypothetical protein
LTGKEPVTLLNSLNPAFDASSDINSSYRPDRRHPWWDDHLLHR